jgi:hypothetical protein
VIDHAPLGMARLGPGIGVEQVNEAQRGVRQALQHLQRVAHVQADVGEALIAHMAERADDAVEERLAADEAVVRQEIGAVGEMLPRTEADLEMERPGRRRTALLHGSHLPQARSKPAAAAPQGRLPLPQLMA